MRPGPCMTFSTGTVASPPGPATRKRRPRRSGPARCRRPARRCRGCRPGWRGPGSGWSRSAAASTTPGQTCLRRGCSRSSAPVTAAPIRQPPCSSVTVRVSRIFLMSTISSGSTTSARICTRRSVPPASTLASPLAPARRATTPSSDSGASYRILSGLLRALRAPPDMIPQARGGEVADVPASSARGRAWRAQKAVISGRSARSGSSRSTRAGRCPPR